MWVVLPCSSFSVLTNLYPFISDGSRVPALSASIWLPSVSTNLVSTPSKGVLL